jgi:hypothetical protein
MASFFRQVDWGLKNGWEFLSFYDKLKKEISNNEILDNG